MGDPAEERAPEEIQQAKEEAQLTTGQQIEVAITGVAIGFAMAVTPEQGMLFVSLGLMAALATIGLRELSRDGRRPPLREAFSKASWIMTTAGVSSVAVKIAEFLIHRAT